MTTEPKMNPENLTLRKVSRLNLTGYVSTIEFVTPLLENLVKEFQKKYPDLSVSIDDCGYLDTIGGYHSDGCGWNPEGKFCGECSSMSCLDCGVWDYECRKRINEELNKTNNDEKYSS